MAWDFKFCIYSIKLYSFLLLFWSTSLTYAIAKKKLKNDAVINIKAYLLITCMQINNNGARHSSLCAYTLLNFSAQDFKLEQIYILFLPPPPTYFWLASHPIPPHPMVLTSSHSHPILVKNTHTHTHTLLFFHYSCPSTTPLDIIAHLSPTEECCWLNY